jgi:hypothetical protein
MTHAAAMVGCRRNSGTGTGTASVARAPGSIATGAAGSTVAATTAAAMATTAATTTTAMCKGDLAGRQMTAKQCDGGSGQRRTNDRRYYEPLQSLW